MLALLSPSKGQDFSALPTTGRHTIPVFAEESQALINELRKFDSHLLQDLMAVSPKIAALNVERYQQFSLPFHPQNSKQALCAFTGDVYGAMDVGHYGPEDFAFAQDHLRILSGLYGCLRPLDLIQPYRLEMKTKLANSHGPDLYKFWGTRITEAINGALAGHEHKIVINLASNEYFRAVQREDVAADLVTINFKEVKDGKARVVAIFAKRARGMMTDFIIRHRIDAPTALRDFSQGGYCFDENHSDQGQYTFVRPQPS